MSNYSNIALNLGNTKLSLCITTMVAAAFLLLLFAPSSIVMYFLWFFVGLLSTINPSLGIYSWIIFLPYEIYFVQYYNFSPFLGLTPALLLGYIIYASFKKFSYSVKINSILFICLFFISSLIAWIFNLEPEMYRNIVSLALLLAVFAVISWEIELKPNSFWLFSLAIVIASLLSLIGVGVSGWGWRIDLAGNVRVISNLYGINMILLAGSIMLKQNSKYLIPFKNFKTVAIALFLLNGVLLFLTVSRGVVISVLVSITAMYLACWFYKKSGIGFNKRYFIWIIVSAFSIGAIGINYFERIGGQMITRLMLSPFEDVRFSIWNQTINRLDGFEWFFGAGLGKFKDLSPISAHAHSVYIDTFVSLGFLGLIILSGFILLTLVKVIKKRDILGLGLTMFLILSFSTHGSLSNKYFWLVFALCYGLSMRRMGWK